MGDRELRAQPPTAITRWAFGTIVAAFVTLVCITLLPPSRLVLLIRAVAGVITVTTLYMIHRTNRRHALSTQRQLDELAKHINQLHDSSKVSAPSSRRVH